MTDVVEKRCSGCGETKPAAAFDKDCTKSDGLNCRCKVCRALQYQGLSPGVAKGIESVDQLASVLRVMAELQAATEAENEACRKRVALVKEYSDQSSESWKALLVNWRRMLRKFVSKQPGRRGVFVRRCEFGSVRFKDGNMKVQLDWKLAGSRLGKP